MFIVIDYIVTAPNPHTHLFHVRMILSAPDAQGQKCALPNWIPGSYLIRDFARHIISIVAWEGEENARTVVPIHKINSNTWECGQTQLNGSLTIEYTVYAYDLSVRGAYLDDTRAFFNGACLFLCPLGQENAAYHVHIHPPHCSDAPKWRVATTLSRAAGTSRWGYGEYIAENYATLIDNPVEIGDFEICEFTAKNIPHTLIISGKYNTEIDITRIKNDLMRICEAQMRIFPDFVPFSEYLFMLTVGKLYGGLEHSRCSVSQIMRECLPMQGLKEADADYIVLLGLLSHEYFHAWNVKTLKPAAFMPYDLNHKSYTQQLWAFEGITSYYDSLALLRSGCITQKQYLELLAQDITKLLRNPGRKIQTVVDASFDAWIKFYQPNENSPNALVSYYLKGSLIALILDLALRLETQHQYSLDNILQILMAEYGQKKQGLPEGKIEALLGEIGGEVLKKLTHILLHTTDELPLAALLEKYGITLKLKAQDPEQGAWGCTFVKQHGKIVITQIFEGGAAQLAGLCAQDEIIALNDIKVESDSFDKIIKKCKINTVIMLHIFRQDILIIKTITLQAPILDMAEVVVKENSDSIAKHNLTQWLYS